MLEDSEPQSNRSLSSKVASFVSPALLPKAQGHSRKRSPSVIRKVQSVASLIPETSTCTTEQQSFAEVVLYAGNKKRSESLHPGVRLTCSVEAFSSIDYLGPTGGSEVDKGITRTTSSGIPQPTATDFHKASSLQHLRIESSSPDNQSSPVSNCSTLVTPSCQKDFDFVVPLSQASTAVLQNTSSSSDTGSEADIDKLPLLDTWDNSEKLRLLSPLSHSQPTAEEEIFLNNLFSPHHLSNSSVSKIDHTGILTAEHKFSSNQDIFHSLNKSPERETIYHFSLTQKSEEPSPRVSLDYTNFRNPNQLKSFGSDSFLRDLSILSPEKTSVSHTSEWEGSDSVFSVHVPYSESKGQSSQSKIVEHHTLDNSVYPDSFSTISSTTHCKSSHPANKCFSSSNSAHTVMSVGEAQYRVQETDNTSSYHSEPVDIPDTKTQGHVLVQDDVNKALIPHHSLILATSGPDSPCSYKVSVQCKLYSWTYTYTFLLVPLRYQYTYLDV